MDSNWTFRIFDKGMGSVNSCSATPSVVARDDSALSKRKKKKEKKKKKKKKLKKTKNGEEDTCGDSEDSDDESGGTLNSQPGSILALLGAVAAAGVLVAA
ncbi:hypothetical protein IFR05_008326 [Cadophora sp. M221]|nr:hypothetical protein IFR05_008326 [Cadophora sp. M221]